MTWRYWLNVKITRLWTVTSSCVLGAVECPSSFLDNSCHCFDTFPSGCSSGQLCMKQSRLSIKNWSLPTSTFKELPKCLPSVISIFCWLGNFSFLISLITPIGFCQFPDFPCECFPDSSGMPGSSGAWCAPSPGAFMLAALWHLRRHLCLLFPYLSSSALIMTSLFFTSVIPELLLLWSSLLPSRILPCCPGPSPTVPKQG